MIDRETAVSPQHAADFLEFVLAHNVVHIGREICKEVSFSMWWETNIRTRCDPRGRVLHRHDLPGVEGADRRDSVWVAVRAGECDADRGNDFGDGECDGREPEGGG